MCSNRQPVFFPVVHVLAVLLQEKNYQECKKSRKNRDNARRRSVLAVILILLFKAAERSNGAGMR
jgi:hypothetical protein